MEQFTPVSALIGGSLIGISAVLLMLFLGRIAGISGIVSGALFANGERAWRIAFILGLISAPVIYTLVSSQAINIEFSVDFPIIIVGGVLVGFGTRLGSGCTSGHGVCGLSRFSSRSAVSVAIFMAIAIITVSVVTQIVGA